MNSLFNSKIPPCFQNTILKKKNNHIAWFHLYKILINTKDTVTNVGGQLPRARWELQHEDIIKSQQKTIGNELMDIFIFLIVLMFSQVYTYIKAHQIILFKSTHFIIFQLYISIAFLKRKILETAICVVLTVKIPLPSHNSHG